MNVSARKTVLLGGWALLASSLVTAPHGLAAESDGAYQGFARVIKATPIVSRSISQVPVKRCTWERLPSRTRYYPEYNQRRVTERRAKRCRTTYESRVQEKTTGYHVTLNYNGETFEKRTAKHPGSRMPVSIEIAPLNE